MPEQQTGAGAGTGDGGAEQRLLTQEDVERIASKEKAQGRRAGQRELLEEAGFADADEFRAFVEAARRREQEALTEQQRREQEVAQREAAAARREEEARQRLAEANRRAALVSLGATDENLEDALALLSARVSTDADEDALAAEAKALAERRPELFTVTSTTPPTPDTRLRGVPRTPNPPTVTPGARGRSEAQRRFGITLDA